VDRNLQVSQAGRSFRSAANEVPPSFGKSLFAPDCVVGPGGVSLPRITNNLRWQPFLEARFDSKCNLAAVANPPLHRRPESGTVHGGVAAARVTAARTAVLKNKCRSAERAAAS